MRTTILLALMYVLLICGSRAAAAENAALAAALNSITADELSGHVGVLADDTFEGREAGSRGGRAAALYLKRNLSQYGLQAGGAQGSWFQRFDGTKRNVLGMLAGNDETLKAETIVIGAHYDHVGYGSPNNSYGPTGYIHNGADDNASGIAALLELAQALTLAGGSRRSLLFALWDGEEQGLLGSRHWLSDPSLPLRQVPIMINLDMIGRMRNARLEVGGTRTSWRLRRLVSQSAADDTLSIDFTWKVEANSDHWPFYERNIPFLLLHTGLHSDYHRPSDDVEKINARGMEQVSRLLLRLVMQLGSEDKLPGFRPAAKNETPSGRLRLERALASLPTRLGVWWDEQASAVDGLIITRVLADSPAAQAGLRIGDRLLELDGQKIASGDELRAAVLAAPSATSVLVRRAGQQQPRKIDLQLAGSPVRVGIAWREDDAEPGTIFLTRVVPGSPADRAGLKVRDRIYQFGGEDFAGSEQFGERLAAASGPVSLLIERRGSISTVELVLQPAAAKQEQAAR